MKIAVIRISSLGDVVLATAIFQKLIAHYPHCEIDFITGSAYAPLFKEDKRIHSVIPYERSSEGIGYMARFMRSARREHYDMIIDAHGNLRSIILSYLCRARVRRRVKKYSLKRRLMVLRHAPREIPHVVQRYLSTVDGREEGMYKPVLEIDNAEFEIVQERIREMSGSRKVVGIAPGAGRTTKIWHIEKLQRLSLRLAGKHGIFLVFLGEAANAKFIETICAPLENTYLNLAGKTDFRQLALYLKTCDVVLSSDSGPLHVAVAVNTPVVALFGPTVPEFGFRPFDERSVVISSAQPCRPCSLHGSDRCPLGHHRCMKDIEVETVENAILGLLEDTEKQYAVGSKE